MAPKHPNEYELLVLTLGLICMVLFFSVLGSTARAADLSTDPYDGEASASYVQPASEAEASDPAPDSGAPDASVSYEYDYYDDEEDVVVSRAHLEAVVTLLNDLSRQLALYAAEVPSGYQPTESDLAYRDDLLQTLSAISDNLTLLAAPLSEEPVEEVEEVEEVEAEETTEAETSAPAESSAPADASASAETDPADTSDMSADASASSSIEEDVIQEQDFYKLVLALLLVIAFLPFVGWVYKFISSFFPV